MAAKITVSASEPLQAPVELLVVGVPTKPHNRGIVPALRAALGPALSRAMKRAEFTGKKGQLCDVPSGGGSRAARVALVGLGPTEEVCAADLRRMAAIGARHAATLRATSMAVTAADEIAVPGGLRALGEGVVLGGYRFERYKTGDQVTKFPLTKALLLVKDKVDAAAREAAALGQAVGEAVCIARDLINMPPNELYPEALGRFAKELANERKALGLSCTVLGPKQIREKGMNLLDAVGRGSAHGPCLIHLTYRPPSAKGKALKRFAFVGKGLTFDTGGICIKPAAGMEEMKGDMGGAANVIALMAALAATRPEVEVHGIIGSAENMPDGDAYRPGDIFKSYQGKTVEIINTDAEGRLVLADALHYAVELQPEMLLDNATLTGACVVALGQTVSGYFSNRDDLADRLAQACKRSGEAMWRLPLVEDLRELLKSDWADVKHMGDRWGGSITAALFLREFVGETPWIHVDIAGPSMANKAYDVYAKGGTGHGVLSYLELIGDLLS